MSILHGTDLKFQHHDISFKLAILLPCKIDLLLKVFIHFLNFLVAFSFTFLFGGLQTMFKRVDGRIMLLFLDYYSLLKFSSLLGEFCFQIENFMRVLLPSF